MSSVPISLVPGHDFSGSAILALFVPLFHSPDTLNNYGLYLDIRSTALNTITFGKSSIWTGTQDFHSWHPSTSSYELSVAYSTNNGTNSIYRKLLLYHVQICIHHLWNSTSECVVFKQCKIKTNKQPCAYYSNSCATFQCMLEGDLVFKLNPSPADVDFSCSLFSRVLCSINSTCKIKDAFQFDCC